MPKITTVEQKALARDRAREFINELMDSYESFTGIAEEYGLRTLVDLMYLNAALLTGGYIEVFSGESQVVDVIQKLPSGKQWMQSVNVEVVTAAA